MAAVHLGGRPCRVSNAAARHSVTNKAWMVSLFQTLLLSARPTSMAGKHWRHGVNQTLKYWSKDEEEAHLSRQVFISLRCGKSDLRELLPNSLDSSHRSFWYRAPTVTERWTNYGKAAICGLLRVLIRPTKHEEIIVTVKSHKVALFY